MHEARMRTHARACAHQDCNAARSTHLRLRKPSHRSAMNPTCVTHGTCSHARKQQARPSTWRTRKPFFVGHALCVGSAIERHAELRSLQPLLRLRGRGGVRLRAASRCSDSSSCYRGDISWVRWERAAGGGARDRQPLGQGHACPTLRVPRPGATSNRRLPASAAPGPRPAQRNKHVLRCL